MEVTAWDVPINAAWQKSNILIDLAYSEDGLEIVLLEEESRQRWVIHFEEVLAFKVIRDEYSKWSTELVPADGGFFEISDSPWLAALGLADTSLEEIPHHFLICCQGELIEVAAWECLFTVSE